MLRRWRYGRLQSLIFRQEVRLFTEKQIALVDELCRQAVIAIENTRLLSELRASLDRQTATPEVLGVISRSKFDLQPILQSVVETAERLCRAEQTVIFRLEDGAYRFAAGHSRTPEYLEIEQQAIILPSHGTVIGRAVLTQQVARIDDAWSDPLYERKGDAKIGGARSMIGVPLMRQGEPIGAIGLARSSVDPFTDREIELVATFADQAVIAIENARLFEAEQQRTRELTELLEQQTATSEVLQVISSSPGDLEPVFETMLENAVRICDATFGNIHRWDGEALHILASLNTPPAFAEFRKRSALRPGPEAPFGRMVATKTVVHVTDLSADPAYIEQRAPTVVAAVELGSVRTILYVPMLKENELIGAFTLSRSEVRPFTDKQIAVVTNFAAQAVIAIENARLLGELRESLERQTATSEILRAIAASPGDAEGSLHKIAETTAQLFDAAGVSFRIAEGDEFKLSVGVGQGAEQVTTNLYADPALRPTVGGRNLPGKVVRENRQIHLPDLDHLDSEFADWPGPPVARRAGIRTIIGTPLRTKGAAVGALVVYRNVLRPFEAAEMQLLQTFADQAVIAIENARLLSELRESLEQQTATAEVLSVISSSPGDLAPVFDAMLKSATQLCEANFGTFFLRDGEALRLVARHVPAKGSAFFEPGSRLVVADNEGHPLVRVLETKDVMHLADLRADPSYAAGNPRVVAFVEKVGSRTALCVPMMKDDECIGVIVTSRPEVRPFTDKQIDLVKNFAAQAVIAIENARLLSELRESLERQTATSKVLEVISSSPGELEPVFTAMLENAVRICDATFGNIYRLEGRLLHLAAAYNTPPALAAHRKNIPMGVEQNQLVAPMMATKSPNQVLDAAAVVAYTARSDPAAVTAVELGGVRTSIAVPMLKDNELIGSLSLYRQEVRPFTDKQIALVAGFANQAVIAIENARLLTELRESLEQQTATADVLRVISSSPGDLDPVFQAVLENATRICEAKFGMLLRFDGQSFHFAAGVGMPPEMREFLERRGAFQPMPDSHLERVLRTKRLSYTADYAAEGVQSPPVKFGGARSTIDVPLLKNNELIGAFSIYRQEVRPFTDKQIELVQNFAAQAVIAIENARLLGELRARTDELARSVEELRVLGETSQAVNSTLDLEMVLNTIVTKAVQLSGTEAGAIYVFDERSREFRLRATVGMEQGLITALGDAHIRLDDQNVALVLANREPVQVADLGEAARSPVDQIVLRAGFRARLAAPLFSGDDIVGLLVVRRRTPGTFCTKYRRPDEDLCRAIGAGNSERAAVPGNRRQRARA